MKIDDNGIKMLLIEWVGRLTCDVSEKSTLQREHIIELQEVLAEARSVAAYEKISNALVDEEVVFKCPDCGSSIVAGDDRCGSCGISISSVYAERGEYKCSICGGDDIEKGFNFCPTCGAALFFEELEKITRGVTKNT